MSIGVRGLDNMYTLMNNCKCSEQCRIIHKGQMTEAFHISTGVSQGGLLSRLPFLFEGRLDHAAKGQLDYAASH